MYLLGIDIGTTNWKANLYDLKGRLVASSSVPTPTLKDRQERHYYSPYALWKYVCRLTQKITSNIKSPDLIAGLSIASMAEAGLIINKSGKPVSNVIPWYDKRSIRQMEWFENKISREELFLISGINLNYIYSAMKIQWLKENERKSFLKADRWLCIPDYLIYKLTGELATDYSIASRTMLFDIKKRKWSRKLLNILQIDENFLPKVFPSSTIISNVSAKASKETGLSTKTKIILGGHDHVCGSLGVGIVKKGLTLDSIGTAESVVIPINDIKNINGIYKSGFSVGCYVYKDMYYAMSGLYYSGGLIEWFIKEFYDTNIKKETAYRKIINDAKSFTDVSHGIFVFPHWLGTSAPFCVSNAKGTIIGLTPNTQKKDLSKAIFEGLSYEYKLLIETIENKIGINVKELIVIGGGAKNNFWLKVKSSVLGKNLIIPHIPECVCFGASILAGIGVNLIKDPMDIIKNFKKDIIKPNRDLYVFYKKTFKNDYMRMYKSLLEIWKGYENIRTRN